MKANEQTAQQVERAIKKIAQKFPFIIRKTKCCEKTKRSVQLRKTKRFFLSPFPHAKRLGILRGVSVSHPLFILC